MSAQCRTRPDQCTLSGPDFSHQWFREIITNRSADRLGENRYEAIISCTELVSTVIIVSGVIINHVLWLCMKMKSLKIVRILKNNPRYWCKYFVWTNVFLVLYFVISLDSDDPKAFNIDLENKIENVNAKSSKISVTKNYKFEEFDLSNWKENQNYKLQDTSKEIFMYVYFYWFFWKF